MTLQQLFDLISGNPAYILFYFAIIPFAALLANLLGKGEGHLSPWKFLYAILIFQFAYRVFLRSHCRFIFSCLKNAAFWIRMCISSFYLSFQ